MRFLFGIPRILADHVHTCIEQPIVAFIAVDIVKRHIHHIPCIVQVNGVGHMQVVGRVGAETPHRESRNRGQRVERIGIALTIGAAVQQRAHHR